MTSVDTPIPYQLAEPSLPELPLKIRGMRQADLPFVISTWAQSLAMPHWMAKDEYLTNMRKSASITIERSKRVIVLCSAEHEATIFGWACGDDGVVHHAYARPSMRKSEAGRKWVAALIGKAMGG